MKDKELLKKLAQARKALAKTSSTSFKCDILIEFLEGTGEVGRRALDCVYNNFRRYHLTSVVAQTRLPKSAGFSGMFEVFDSMNDRLVSGHVAGSSFMDLVVQHGESEQSLLYDMLDKDLSCRTGIATVNKALKATGMVLIPTFKVSLGVAMDKGWVPENYRDWFVSRKYDGIRCLAFLKKGKEPMFLSRTGKPILTLGKLGKALQEADVEECVLDGEIGLRTRYGEDDFKGICSEYRRKGHTIENPVYSVFDVLTHDAFKAGKAEVCFWQRIKYLRKVVQSVDSPMVVRVKQKRLKDAAHLGKRIKSAAMRGEEGLILRRDAPYVGKRSKDLLKVKQMHDVDLRVTDVVLGEMNCVDNGREANIDVLTAATVDYKGTSVGVGSGWTINQRKEFFEHPEKLIGKIITVQYFEETENDKGEPSLRFPVVKAIHGKKRVD